MWWFWKRKKQYKISFVVFNIVELEVISFGSYITVPLKHKPTPADIDIEIKENEGLYIVGIDEV